MKFLILLFILLPKHLLAASGAINQFNRSLNTAGCAAGLCPDEEITDTYSLIGSIITGLLNFLGVAFLLLIIYGGIIWMTAAGNDQRIEKAKKIIINSTIGLAIIFLAQIITFLIIDILLPQSKL